MTVVVLWRIEVPRKCSSRCAQATDPSSFRNLWSCPVWVLEEQVLLGLIGFLFFFVFVTLLVGQIAHVAHTWAVVSLIAPLCRDQSLTSVYQM